MKLNEIKRVFELDDSPLSDTMQRLGISLRGGAEKEADADVDVDRGLYELINKSILSTRPISLSDSAVKAILDSEKTKAMYTSGISNLEKILKKIDESFTVDASRSEPLAKILGDAGAAKRLIDAANKDHSAVQKNLQHIQKLIDDQHSVLFESITKRSSATKFPSAIVSEIAALTDPAEVKRRIVLFTMLIDVLQANTKAIETKLS